MKRGLKSAVALAAALCFSAGAIAVRGEERSWNKIRYSAGTVQVKVNPFDYNTTLKIWPDRIELVFAGKKREVIPLSAVVSLTSGTRAYARVIELTTGQKPPPQSLFGVLRKMWGAPVGIEYRGADGRMAAVLLGVDYRYSTEVLQSLTAATGRSVEY